MLCLETQFNLNLINKFLAADRESTQTSDRLVPRYLHSIQLRPIRDAPFEIVTTTGDVPAKAGHEMTVRAYIKPIFEI
jgi:hypothetical protein